MRSPFAPIPGLLLIILTKGVRQSCALPAGVLVARNADSRGSKPQENLAAKLRPFTAARICRRLRNASGVTQPLLNRYGALHAKRIKHVAITSQTTVAGVSHAGL